MAREKKPEEVKKGAPEWMNTFSDMMTLLLCFFVLLFSMSQIDAEKWKEIVRVFSKDPAIFDKVNMAAAAGPEGMNSQDMSSSSSEGEYKDAADQWQKIGAMVSASLDEIAQQLGDQGMLEMKQTENEITIRVHGDILFDTASDTLKQSAKPAIEEVMAEAVIPYAAALSVIRFEGHTDVRPISTFQFPNNMYLSTARATAVWLFVKPLFPDVNQSIYACMGFGETRPIDPANTPSAWEKNRRVDIVMVKKVFTDSEGNAVTVNIPGLDKMAGQTGGVTTSAPPA